MTISAHEQLRQVMSVIPHLADAEDHLISDVAAKIGIAPRDLLKVLTTVSERYDVPGGFVEGLSIYIEGNETVNVRANHLHRPMRLTMPELCALELGLTMLRRERTPAEQAPIDRALGRLRAAISMVPSNDQHEGTRYAELAVQGSVEHLTTLRAAQQSGTKVRLRYRSGSATSASERTICPHALLYAEQMWYVAAVCDDTVVRFFRLDRIEDAIALDERFTPDPSTVTALMERGKPFTSKTDRRMTVKYSPRVARWIAEREGQALAADGSLVMEHVVADDMWAIRHVLQYGAEAEIVSPPEMRRLVGERLAAMT